MQGHNYHGGYQKATLMESSSFALVRLPGDSPNRMHLFMGPETLHPISVSQLSQKVDHARFFFSPWNTSETIFELSEFRGVLNLGEAFLWIDEIHKRQIGTESTSFQNFETSIKRAKGEMALGKFEKVVLAREKFIPTEIDTSELGTIFYALCKAHPQAFVYICSSQNWGTWMGASPETLVNYTSGSVSIMSLAGTLFNDAEKWSSKESAEQTVTSKFIETCLNWSPTDSVAVRELRQGKLRHLMSVYQKEWNIEQIPELVVSLSPTPAVCGNPRNSALNFIQENESFTRDLYAGYIGISSPDGIITNVNLRCAEIGVNGVRLLAGCGINKDSQALREWEESGLKMSVIEEYLS